MPQTAVLGLSPEQRQTFEARGLVRLERAIPRRDAEGMADRLWEGLERFHRIRRRERRTWRIERPGGLQPVQNADAFRDMASPVVVAALDDLLGRGRWTRPVHWGQPLVCFPQAAGRWDVPRQAWHLDLPADPARQGKLVGRIFALLAPLQPRGGGTLVATGSHRIVQRLADAEGEALSSSQMRKRLAGEHRWFAELMGADREGDRVQRYMEAATEVAGVPLQVEEMTGEPGDVWIMHPAALHAMSPNVLETPRLALSQFVMPEGYPGLPPVP